MDRVVVESHLILVLAEGDSVADSNNARGHLFEEFIALLLEQYGYDKPRRERINYSADGIELDVTASSTFSNTRAIAECKAYSSNVPAQACTSFIGKLQLARYDAPDSDIHGYLCVIPKLVAQGEEVARKASAVDRSFHYLNADTIVDRLLHKKIIREFPADIDTSLISTPAVLITKYGIFSAAKVIDECTQRTDHVLVWGKNFDSIVPQAVVDLLADDSYASATTIRVATTGSGALARRADEHTPPVIVAVRASSSDFEYQFPASPKFFVGRKQFVQEVQRALERRRGTFVLNAQSGWGKSSLALQAKQMVENMAGYAAVIDSRTANTPSFVVEALREVAVSAEKDGLLKLPEKSSWASLQSAVSSLAASTWLRDAPLLLFFDQFENVFQDERTTREFRDLTLLVNELACRIFIGFAWKTDLITMTESHPYVLRDAIRNNGDQISLGPMGSRDIDALIRRLEKALGQKMSPDLRQRAREYSQGLPWLFKKLANHIMSEIQHHGKSQELLVSEGLNVQSLFDSDLAGLNLIENEAIRHIARFAPVAASEVTEKYDGVVVQALLNARLVVAVGDKLDTYWDIFRDFLNNNRVPIEDTYIVRQNPSSAARLLIEVLRLGGAAGVPDLCGSLDASATQIYNMSRELRLFGLTAYEPNRVKLLEDVIESSNAEEEIRRRVGKSLRRHRAYSLYLNLADRYGDAVMLSTYARELPSIFPAVDAQAKTWLSYARAFALWFNYSGLSLLQGNKMYLPPDGYGGDGQLLSSDHASRARTTYSLTLPAPTCLRYLLELSNKPVPVPNAGSGKRRMRVLNSLGLVTGVNGKMTPIAGAVVDGHVNKELLRTMLLRYPGSVEAMQLLEHDPSIENLTLGKKIRDAIGAAWTDATASDVGGDFRGWAKAAGVDVKTARRLNRRN